MLKLFDRHRDSRSRSRSRSYHSSRHHQSSRYIFEDAISCRRSRSRSRSRSHSRSRATSHSRSHVESRNQRESKVIEDAISSIHSSIVLMIDTADSTTENPAPPADPAAQDPAQAAEDDPNNVHKQCEQAAVEARKRAMNLLRKCGLIPEDMIETPEEEAPAPVEEAPAPVEEAPVPVNPLLPKLVTPIAEGQSTGPLSWYKP